VESAVLYAARSGGYDLMFTAHGPALTLADPTGRYLAVDSNPAPAIEAIGKLPHAHQLFR